MSLLSRYAGLSARMWTELGDSPRETHPEAGRAASDCSKQRCQCIDRAVDPHVQVVSADLRCDMQ